MEKFKVGVIGSGGISYTYLNNLTKNFSIIDCVGCSDLIPEKSAKRAEQFGIRQMTTEEILADPEIKIVVNITEPINHYKVNMMALEAGKHVYVEKMMCANVKQAEEVIALAQKKGLRVAPGPDTFLGGAIQTARKILDDGWIGKVQSAQILIARGYHYGMPFIPEKVPFIFDAGGTLPYDMGSYYLQAIQFLLGPVKRVAGFGRVYEDKIYSHPANPKYKELVPIPDSTFIQGTLEFASGAYGSFTALGESFEEVPRIEIYGSEGILSVPDPNCYDGPVLLKRASATRENRFYEIPLTHGYGVNTRPAPDPNQPHTEENGWAYSFRGLGVADLAWAIKNNRPQRCAVENGIAALEIIEAITECGKTGKVHEMKHIGVQQKPLRSGFVGFDKEAVLDD